MADRRRFLSAQGALLHAPVFALPALPVLLFLLLLLLLVWAGPMAGPVEGQHALSVGLGRGLLAVQDEQASPLRYTGWGWTGGLGYRYDGTRYQHRIDLAYREMGLTASGAAAAVGGSHPADLREARVLHELTVKVAARGRVGVRAGLAFAAEAAWRQQGYGRGIEESYLLGVAGIGPSAQLSAPVSTRSRIQASVSVPVVALVIRSPYAVKGPVRARLEPVGGFVRVLPRLAYRWRFTDRLALEVAGRGQYGSLEEPFTLRSLDRSLVVSGEWWP